MKRKFIILLSILVLIKAEFSYSQKDTIILKNGIDRPSILSTHHFGIFSARINQNFKVRPPNNATLQFSLASGNNFHPYVEAYLPKDPSERNRLSQVIWYDRRFEFIDQETTPADYMNIVIDAVFKGFRVDFNTRLGKNNELGISLRSYLVTKGNYPFSFFTNDEFIEWIHSNIAGGEDAFGRKYYGLNQVNIKYTDRNGRILELKNGDFNFAGIEINHFYYPEFINLKNRYIQLNLGSHLGINTSKFNRSMDIGLSVNTVKKWALKNKNELQFAFGLSLLRKNIVNFNDVVDLGNNRFLGSLEAMFEHTKYGSKNNYHSFSVNYKIQTRYNKLEETDYYFLIGKWQEIPSGWSNGIRKLYMNLSAWTLMYSYGTKNYTFSAYIKEDVRLNNAPDLQTGVSLKIPLSK